MPSMSFNRPLGPSHLPPASPASAETTRSASGGTPGFAGMLDQQVQAREAEQPASRRDADPPSARRPTDGRPRSAAEGARSAHAASVAQAERSQRARAAASTEGSAASTEGSAAKAVGQRDKAEKMEKAGQPAKAEEDRVVAADTPSTAQAVLDCLARMEEEPLESADEVTAALAPETLPEGAGDPSGLLPGLAALASGGAAGQALAGRAKAGTASSPGALALEAAGLSGAASERGAHGAAGTGPAGGRAALADSTDPAAVGFGAQRSARDTSAAALEAGLAAGAQGLAGATADVGSTLRSAEPAGAVAQATGLPALPGLQPLAAAESGRSAPPQALQLLIATPVTAPDFSASLATQLTTLARDGIQEATLQLNPAEMGPIAIRIVLDGARAQVDFAAQHAQTREVIESGMPTLAAALHGAGLTLSGGGVFEQRPGTPGEGSSGRSGRDSGIPSGDDAGDLGAVPPPRRAVAGLVDMYA